MLHNIAFLSRTRVPGGFPVPQKSFSLEQESPGGSIVSNVSHHNVFYQRYPLGRLLFPRTESEPPRRQLAMRFPGIVENAPAAVRSTLHVSFSELCQYDGKSIISTGFSIGPHPRVCMMKMMRQ